ncbi:MAG: ABC transporter permease [Acidobacteria bacterium]|nr:ABC transporter permease [Acidobacteriota bacterium]
MIPNWKRAIEDRLAGARIDAARRLEIVDELSQHLQDRYDELRAGGAPDDAARLAALNELDEKNLVRELVDVERPPLDPLPLGGGSRDGVWSGIWQDVRFGARLIVKEPATALVVVFTLALAIAANTIVFGFTDLLLLRPLPLGNIKRLVAVYTISAQHGQDRQPVSIPDFLDMRAQSTSLDGLSAMSRQQVSLTGSGDPRAINVAYVTANHFRVWGVPVIRGRAFLDGEDAFDRGRVAVLSDHFWKTHFTGADSAIDQTLTLNGRSYAVIGVLTPDIELGNIGQTDVWLPLELRPSARRDDLSLIVFGLLKPEATLAGAQAELRTIDERLQQTYPVTNAGRQWLVLSGRDATVGTATWVLLALLTTVVGLVLLVACANVATVMLARASARRREIAVRVALGASRGRLVRQLVLEGLLLGLASGGLGLLLAYLGLSSFRALSIERYFQNLAINFNLLTFAFFLSLLAPVLFGVMPALQSSRPNLNEDLKDGGRDAASSVRGGRSRSVLVVVQVGFAFAVLIVSGLIVRTVVAMEHVPVGVTADGLLTLHVRFDPPKYTDDEARFRTVESILDRFAAVPGVVAAGASTGLPVIDSEPARRFAIAGRPLPQAKDLPWMSEAATAGEYAQAIDVRVLEGRMWRPEDRASGWNVAVVNREAARRYWPGESPIGAHVTMADPDGRVSGDAIEIVGIVDNVLSPSVNEPPPPRIYRPLARRPLTSVAFEVRVAGDASAVTVAPALRDALRAADRDLAVSDIRTFSDEIKEELRSQDLIMVLFGSFAAIGLIVAITGIYGVTAFSIGQRRHEIGVRLALGATAPGVVRLIMGRSFRLIGIGVVLGLLGGWAIGLTMRNILFGVGAIDPLTYLAVLAVVGAGGFVATYLPAHRVVSIDPAVVLKRD